MCPKSKDDRSQKVRTRCSNKEGMTQLIIEWRWVSGKYWWSILGKVRDKVSERWMVKNAALKRRSKFNETPAPSEYKYSWSHCVNFSQRELLWGCHLKSLKVSFRGGKPEHLSRVVRRFNTMKKTKRLLVWCRRQVPWRCQAKRKYRWL